MDSQKKKITIIVSSIIASLLLIVAFALFWTFSKKQEEPFNFQEAFNNINESNLSSNCFSFSVMFITSLYNTSKLPIFLFLCLTSSSFLYK